MCMLSKKKLFSPSTHPLLIRRRLTIFYFTGTEQVAEPQKPMKAKQRFLIERSVGSKSFHVFSKFFSKNLPSHSEKWVGFGLKVVYVWLLWLYSISFPQWSLLMQTLILSTTRISLRMGQNFSNKLQFLSSQKKYIRRLEEYKWARKLCTM